MIRKWRERELNTETRTKIGESAGKIRMIALDLDGTLLNSAKELTLRARAALERAAAAGIAVVPSTGRFYRGIPEQVRSLPFLRCAITINGAQVLSLPEEKSVYEALIPLDRALALLEYLDTLPVMYSTYIDDWGCVSAPMRERAEDYIDYPPSLEMLRGLHKVVPDLKAYLKERGKGVQKLQLFTRDLSFRDKLLSALPKRFPDFQITNAMPNNVEFNAPRANKGDALAALAEAAGLKTENVMAFGDGLNDISMLQAAGLGVAMENAAPAAKAAADCVAASCDADGVAECVEALL